MKTIAAKSRDFLIVVAGLALVVFGSCRSEREIDDSRELAVRMIRSRVIPDPESPAADVLAEIRDFQVDDHGNVYILDSKSTPVNVFDAAGTFLRSFGEKGQGPGEFQFPIRLFIEGPHLSVFNFGSLRMSTFSLESTRRPAASWKSPRSIRAWILRN